MKNTEKIFLSISIMVMAAVAASASAGEDPKRVMAIEVHGVDSADTTSFFLNSDDLGIDLSEMQVGETHSLVDEAGRSILITRTEDGHSINIDGKVIDMPQLVDIDADGDDFNWVSNAEGGEVHVFSEFETATLQGADSTVILSPTAIDAATQDAIRSLLESAGYSSNVEFIDHEGSVSKQVQIKKIEKVVAAPQS